MASKFDTKYKKINKESKQKNKKNTINKSAALQINVEQKRILFFNLHIFFAITEDNLWNIFSEKLIDGTYLTVHSVTIINRCHTSMQDSKSLPKLVHSIEFDKNWKIMYTLILTFYIAQIRVMITSTTHIYVRIHVRLRPENNQSKEKNWKL